MEPQRHAARRDEMPLESADRSTGGSAEVGTLQTNWSLVARLKNGEDNEAWEEFCRLYGEIIAGVSAKAGLTPEEGEDVKQEVLSAFAEHLRSGNFVADAAHGSLRSWLLQRVRWRIQDQLRRRLPVATSGGTAGEASATATTATVERVADAREADLARLCDAEYKKGLQARALEKLPLEVKAEHYQVFHLLLVEQKPVAEVARLMRRNRAYVYLIKHRVTEALKRIVRKLEKELG